MRLVIPDLLPNTGYALQVRANDGANVSEWSARFDILTIQDTVLPTTPTGVSWVVSGDSFIGKWNPVATNTNGELSYITRYEIRLIGNGVEAVISVPHQTGSTPSYTLNFETNRSLFNNPAAAVEFQVRAVDNTDLKSAWSSTITATNPAPAPVTSLVATPLIDQVGLTWVAPSDTDVVGYNIYASGTSGFTPTSGNKVGFSAGTSFNYNTTTYSTWHFVVRSVDKFGSEGIIVRASATPQSSFTVDTTPPNVPTAVTASTGFDTTKQQAWANLAWTASTSTDVKRYEVRYSTTAGTNWQYISVGGDITSARIENLVPNTSYYIDVRAVDFSGNVSAWVNDTGTSPTKYPILVSQDTSAPSTPAAPSAAANTMQLQVSHNGLKAAGGAIESDVEYYEVYAGTAAAPTNMIGTIQASTLDRSGVATFNIPASGGVSQGWIVRVKAVDRAGLKSAYSADSSTVGVPLISATNITNATITNAQISNVNANQITAGTGFINDLTVKSKFTLGDASTVGYIESYDYGASSGATGFQFSKNGLIIKTGAIEAAALKIQDGNNLMPIAYADFEASPTSYVFLKSGGAQTETVLATASRFGSQSVRTTWAAVGAAPVLWMTPASGNYNINVEAGQAYIVSAYVWNTGSVATSVTLGIAWANSAGGSTGASAVATATISAGTTPFTATRISGIVVAPANTVKAAVYSQGNTLTSGAGYNIDGWQVERQMGSLTTPSSWKAPGSTTIDGGMIRTGEIRSSTDLTLIGKDESGTPTPVTLPTWSINMNGAAQFGNLSVRGEIQVGSPDEDEEPLSGQPATISQSNSRIKSYNYIEGVSGWAIHSNGIAEFRSVVTGSLNGEAIQPNTLYADSLVSSSVLSREIIVNGSIHTVGDMGEDIGIDSFGFHVLGPYQVSVTNLQVVSGTVTLTTNIPHGFAALDPDTGLERKLVVSGLGSPYDGTYTISSVGTNTVSYLLAGAPDVNPAISVFGGVVKSKSSNPDIKRPSLIEFPTDGTNPNIISGTLTADRLTVTTGASLRGSTTLDSGNFFISAGVLAPKAAPTVTQTHKTLPLTGSSYTNAVGLTKGHNGNYFVLMYDTYKYYVKEFNSTTGAYIATRLESNISPVTGNPFIVAYSHSYTIRGLAYSPTYSKYYISITDVVTPQPHRPVPGYEYIPDRNEIIKTFNTSFVEDVSGDFVVTTDAGNDAGWSGGGLGLDYTNTSQLIRSIYVSGTGARFTTVTLNGSGIPTSAVAHTTLSGGGSINPNFIFKVSDLDNVALSPARLIVKDRRGTAGNTNYYWKSYSSTAFTAFANESWQPAFDIDTMGAFYDTSEKVVYALNTKGVVKYESGDSNWSNVSSVTSQRWVGYSWYDSIATSTFNVTNKVAGSGTATLTTGSHGLTAGDVGKWIEVRGVDDLLNGFYTISSVTSTTISYASTATVSSASSSGTVARGTYETNLSPVASVLLRKRALIQVTTAPIPYASSDGYPNQARIYLAAGTTQPTLSGTVSTAWKNRATITYDATTALIQSMVTPTGDRPMNSTTNNFSVINTPSMIQSSTGNSYWKGDDSAQFYQLILKSSADVTTTAGNRPPLIIGNYTPGGTIGAHMRVDGNEIAAMTNDSTQGTLILNTGGQTNISDLSVSTIVGGVTGTGTLIMGSVRGSLSVIDLSLDGGGTTGASVNNAGRFVRTTSSARYKDNITPMTLATAQQALGLQAVTFSLKDEIDMDNRPVYPGFIAEQADEVGASLWVFKDGEGRPDGFRYAELTAAHNMLIKELYDRIEELETQVSNFGS